MKLKNVVKSMALWGHTFYLSPFIAACKFGSLLPGENYIFEHHAALLSMVPGIVGRDMRNAFYRHTLKKCGSDLRMGIGALFWSQDTEVGDHVTIGNYSTIGICSIGDNVLIAGHVSIHDGTEQHGSADLDKSISEQEGKSNPPHIGEGCWIGDGAKIAANIGPKTIVGMGAVVLREMPEAVVVLGNPARVVSHRKNPIKKKS